MIRSMTAFARMDRQYSWGLLCWELRSVNHRYLDVSLRLPENLRGVEAASYEKLQAKLKRGKINATLHFQPQCDTSLPIKVNLERAKQVLNAVSEINQLLTTPNQPTALDILKWDGVLDTQVFDIEQITEAVTQLLEETIRQLLTERAREGVQIHHFITQRCEQIQQEIQKITLVLPEVLQGQREKLQSKLADLLNLNSERVEQEIVILAQKIDVAEELDRLTTHIAEVLQLLKQAEPVGRRLDFLVQELHREANTLGAKSNHIATTHSAIELKVLIEQIREQTQNVE